MIIQMSKRTVYYPASNYQATNLLSGSRRIRCFCNAILANREIVSNDNDGRIRNGAEIWLFWGVMSRRRSRIQPPGFKRSPCRARGK